MKWEEIAPIIKKMWGKRPARDDGTYFKPHLQKALGSKDMFFKAAEKFGTPLYILDESQLRKQASFFINAFRKYLPKSEFFYAFKSNDLPYLINVLKDEGFNADVGSLFELQLAIKLNFKNIIFTSPGKSIEELELAIANWDSVIVNVDNEDELDALIELAEKDRAEKRLKISIRVNPDSELMQRWSKFGIKLEHIKRIVEKIKNKNLDLIGFHFHCSWNDTPERYCKNIKNIGIYLKNNFSNDFLSALKFLDLGGGFYPPDQATLLKDSLKADIAGFLSDELNKEIDFDPYLFSIEKVDPLDKFGREISDYLKKYIFSLNNNISIFFEPGRYTNINSTCILLKVIAEKENSVVVDGGINLIGGMDFAEYMFSPIINLSDPSFNLKRKIIYGPLCTPNDLWGYSYFGGNIRKGDILAVLHQGSYNFSRAWRFLKEIAPYAVIKDGKLILAKEKETFSDRYSGCKF